MTRLKCDVNCGHSLTVMIALIYIFLYYRKEDVIDMDFKQTTCVDVNSVVDDGKKVNMFFGLLQFLFGHNSYYV